MSEVERLSATQAGEAESQGRGGGPSTSGFERQLPPVVAPNGLTPTCNDNNACTQETSNPATGMCRTASVKNCSNNNACTADVCVPSTGQCQNPPNVDCNDNNPCTTDRCVPATGTCENPTTVMCAEPTCEVCHPASGQCVDRDPLPPVCAGPAICRTPGFWTTHADADRSSSKRCSQNITQAVIQAAGGVLNVCGEHITTTSREPSGSAPNDAASALEAMCVRVVGNQKLQLVRQLTSAALNCVVSGQSGACVGSDIEALFASCNAVCQGLATWPGVTDCIDAIDCFNNGGHSNGTGCTFDGDNCHQRELPLAALDLPNNDPSSGACFGQQGPGSSDECHAARVSMCEVIGARRANCAIDSAS